MWYQRIAELGFNDLLAQQVNSDAAADLELQAARQLGPMRVVVVRRGRGEDPPIGSRNNNGFRAGPVNHTLSAGGMRRFLP